MIIALVLLGFAFVLLALGLLGGAWSLPTDYARRTVAKKFSKTLPF